MKIFCRINGLRSRSTDVALEGSVSAHGFGSVPPHMRVLCKFVSTSSFTTCSRRRHTSASLSTSFLFEFRWSKNFS